MRRSSAQIASCRPSIVRWLLLPALLCGASWSQAQSLPDEPAPTPGPGAARPAALRPLPAASRRVSARVIVAQQGRVADELVRRIGAELDALGIPSSRSVDVRRTIAQLQRQQAAAIVIEVQAGAVWIWAPSAGRLERRAVVGRRDELPLAAVERVRALRRVGPSGFAPAVPDPERPPGTEGPKRSEAPRVVRRSPRADPNAPRRWTLGVAAGLLGSSGLGVGATLGVGLSYRWRSWLEFDATVIAPLGAASSTTTAGTVDVYAALARVGLALTTDAWGALRPSLGVGVGALLLGLQGTPAPSFEANDSWRVGFAPHLELRLAWQVHPRLTITLAGLVGSALPRVTVSAGAKDLDRWGQPFYSLLAGLALRL